MGRRRTVVIAAASVLAVAAALLVRVDAAWTFAIETEPVTFTSGEDTLTGTLALPQGEGPFGLAVFLHGDGPVTADHDDGYSPIFEALAAIDAVGRHPTLDGRVGLIGFSQGGWPLPLVAADVDVDFAIAASPAISWQRQGRYDLDASPRRWNALTPSHPSAASGGASRP